MIISKVSRADLGAAMARVNQKYDSNVVWNRNDQLSKDRFRITLRVKDSKGKGSRLAQGRLMGYKSGAIHLISACWHVHGDFFEALLAINPNAIIKVATHRIDRYGGNWVDRNIGSIIHPVAYSEACECSANIETSEIMGRAAEIRRIPQSKLTSECWLVQFRGFEACKDCEVKGTPDCGGKSIIKTGKNEKGFVVPINE